MNKEERLKICQECARTAFRRLHGVVPFDELVSVGYVGIAELDGPNGLIAKHAFFHMMRFILREGSSCKEDVRYNKRVESQPPKDDSIDCIDAMRQLKPKEQLLIKQYFYDGMTYKEIAVEEGVSLQQIGLRMNQVKEKMRRMLVR